MTHSLTSLNKQIISCRKCPRLVEWREEVARIKRKAYRDEEYWGKPVPGFGDAKAKVLVVGLAPGAHGSNRTGRNFTGDASGGFLYPALYRAGFANQAEAESRDDGLLTVHRPPSTVSPFSGPTSIYILPGYQFKVVDGMITNFHLPKSTLIMLISAFAGREKILETYEIAIKEGYRFYSFGDAMLIF